MNHTQRAQMAPPQDIIMGPPPLPPQAGQPGTAKQKDPDIAAKYSRLKRKYFELEEKHKEAMLQLRGSGERNVKWRSERSVLLDRIAELELDPARNPGAPVPEPPFTAFPRTLLDNRNQQLFVSNLRQAIDELEREDPDIDPHLLSRHISPAARKRQEAEARERHEEDSRDKRPSATTRKLRGGAPPKGKDIGAPLTYAPAPAHNVPPPASVPGGPPSPPFVVSSGGTRLRLKPPQHPGEGPPGSSSIPPAPHPGAQLAGTPHGHVRRRSESLSPVLSPQEDYGAIPPEGLSPSYQQHGAPPGVQSQMQMTLRTTSSASSRPSDIQRHTKPKRLKAHTVTTKSYSIPTVPRDKRGKPILPLNVGIMTVINLGEVCMREHFHTERYIFPVGYEVTRRYLSTIDMNSEVVYHCKILDGGDGPKFQITAADALDKPIVAGTATGAWSVIVRAANHIRNRVHSNSVSGPDFFGLGQNTIKHLIQELPHANQLKDYVWQHFTEGGPLGGRHAAVIPALPDEQDSPSPGSAGNGNGYFEHPEPEPMPVPIAVPASSGPAQAVLGRHGELQIIQVEKEDPSLRPRHAPPQLNNAPMKPITFHQEYPNAPQEHRGRRGSRNNNSHTAPPPPAYDEYAGNGMQVDSHSPAHSRTASRSPVLHRERTDRDRERDGGYYDHHSQLPPPALPHSRSQGPISSPHQRSAYESHAPIPNGGEAAYRDRERERDDRSPPSAPPPVPATFASIMNAYPAPPMGLPPAGDGGDYANGNSGPRRNGHTSHAPYSPVVER